MFILLMTSLMNSYIPMIALEWLKFHISQLSYHRANKGRQPSTMLLLALPLAAAAVSASYSPSASEAFVDSIAESFSATDGDNDVGVSLPLPMMTASTSTARRPGSALDGPGMEGQ